MNVSASRTYDVKLITDIITSEGIWENIAEDDQRKESFSPDVQGECWLVMKVGEEAIGLYNYHAENCVTVQIHAHVLPKFRGLYSKETGAAALSWLYNHNPEYKKVVAVVPTLYANVRKFCEDFGFKLEGVNRLSYQKNGELIDQWMLGITRDEIGECLKWEK